MDKYLIEGYIPGGEHTIITYIEVDAGRIKVWNEEKGIYFE